jgi:DNA-binding response OmpR family regulator
VPGSAKKILLVCADHCASVEKRLGSAGCVVNKAGEGSAAVDRARREMFDAAVIVSTGSEMDLAETVFNLRDVSSSLQILIVADGIGSSRDLIGRIAATVANTILVDLEELPGQLKRSASQQRGRTQARTRQ